MTCLKIIIKGVVKGVGYLAYTYLTAKKMNIKGYARYSNNDEIEIVVKCSDNILNEFVNKLKFHNTMAIVNEVNIEKCDEEKLINLENFEVYFD